MDQSLDDFEGRPINGRLTGERKQKSTPAKVIDFSDPQSRELAAMDAHENPDDSFLKEWIEWENGLLEWDRRQLTEAKRLKENRNLTERLERNDRRIGNIIEIAFKDDGDVDEEFMDGHAEGGIGLGLSSQAIRKGSAFYNQAYWGRAQRPFVIGTRGRKRDNRIITESMSYALDEWLERANFEKTARRRGRSSMKNGTAILDYEMVRELDYENIAGQFTETRGKIKPRITLWPVRDFDCSNPNMPDPEDQECVWLTKRGCTIKDIQADEATWDFEMDEQSMMPTGYQRTDGVFFNLRRVREMRKNGSEGGASFGGGDGNDSISAFAKFDLIRARGCIPFEVFEENKFSPRMAKWIGVDVGMGDFDDTDEDELNEFWYRLARIPVWKWGRTATDSEGGSGSPGEDILVEFRPSENGTNGIFRYAYGEDDEEFFGYSISDLGGTIETICETLANAQSVIADFNSKPSFIVDKNAFITKTRDTIRKLFRPGQIVEKAGGRMIAEIIEKMEMDTPANIEHWISWWREMFFDQVGVMPAIMGNANAGTLGQDEMNRSTAQNLLEDVLIAHANEDYRLYRQIIKDMWTYLGPDEFRMELISVSGYAAVGIEDALGDTEKVWKMITIKHPSAFGKDPVIVASQLDEKYKIYSPEGVVDGFNMARTSIGLIYQQTDEVMAGGFKVLKPEDEWMQMISAQDTVEPSPAMQPEELDMHAMAHITMLKAIETKNPQIIPPNMVRILAKMTPEHVADFQNRLKMYMAKAMMIKQMQEARMAQAEAVASGPGGGGGGAIKGENAKRNDVKKKAQPKIPQKRAA